MIYPDSTICFFNVPWTSDNENQLTWNSKQEQENYMNKQIGEYQKLYNCSYQRENSAIRVPENIDNIRHYNYVKYTNNNYTDRTFYAFIDSMQYVNDNLTLINITTDLWQTWWDRIALMPSFIERTHTPDDPIGKYLYPENLEYGDYVINNVAPIMYNNKYNYTYCIQVTNLPKKYNGNNISWGEIPQRVYNGMPSGCWYLIFDKNDIIGINRWIKAYDESGQADSILALFPLPLDLTLNVINENGILGQRQKLNNPIYDNTYIIPSSLYPAYLNVFTVPQVKNFEGYVPKNKKLFSFPYCYFNYDNHTGSTITFKFEDFNYHSTNLPTFSLMGAVSTGGDFKLIPTNYKGMQENDVVRFPAYNFSVDISSLPQGSWNSNSFLNWQALNKDAISIQTEHNVASSTLNAFENLAGLNIFGAGNAALNGYTSIRKAMNQISVASLAPAQARGNTATKTLTYGLNLGFGAMYNMTIRGEFAKTIDDFFTMYGYKINQIGTPNIMSRPYFNYIKTIGCNIEGSIPQDDILGIKQIFDNGCTFWHDERYFLDYSVNNSV